MAIDKTILQYNTIEQLREFAQAQSTTILNISKKLKKTEEERDHLKVLLGSNVPAIGAPGVLETSSDDSEYICQIEIAKLKKVTIERELTLEESKRFDTYYKILNNIKSKPANPNEQIKNMDDASLLKLVKKENVNE